MWPDERIGDFLVGAGRCQHVIDPPTDIVSAGVSELTPPGVMTGFLRVSRSKRIDPSSVDPAIHFGALLRQESAGALVGFGSGQIDLMVSSVVVTHHQHGPPFAKTLNSLENSGVKTEFVGNSRIVALFAAPFWKVD